MKWHGAGLYGVRRTRRDGSSFMWHQPCRPALYAYTTSTDIQNTRHKKLVTHVEPHASAVSLLKRVENSAISLYKRSSIQSKFVHRFWHRRNLGSRMVCFSVGPVEASHLLLWELSYVSVLAHNINKLLWELVSFLVLADSKVVLCYYQNWSQYRRNRAFFPEQIEVNHCTHLVFAFAKLVRNQLTTLEWNEVLTYTDGLYDYTSLIDSLLIATIFTSQAQSLRSEKIF